ncbi:fatty acid--CoA ligase family protein [Bacillus carboniphilus]|uniref:Fatty acid--CoA ligase family protein n=1 Tax=Bacillus carboniphilus TaxID=86663 RepID=A0ABY9JVT8_9BACI|nr:fatty acid--CoA ligase family protein [Bacillus carboniphilus]WLR42863.1 fatty acid--CoA ligase family protein [Bacillus carboniphilus]
MNLPKKLAETAAIHQEKPAYLFMDKETSYAELNASVSMFASSLEKMGVQKGDHIALIVGNTPHYVIGLYGALRLGATVIPVNPIYTPDEMGYILNNGDVKLVITLDKLLPLFEKMEKALPKVETIVYCETGETVNEDAYPQIKTKMKPFTKCLGMGDPRYQGPELNEEDVAMILYTSGTTGKPKGAMLTHRNIYANASDVAQYLKYDKSDKVIAALPMFHVFCLTVALNGPLISGATVVIVPKFSPAEIFRLVETYKVTVFSGVPTMYNFLLQYENGKPEAFESLRVCISGGASMPVALLKGFEQKFNVMVSEGYGLSEASPVTAFNPLDRPRKPGSIGTDVMGIKNKVVNELGDEVAPGEVGELVVQGPNVMKGYYKMPEETEHTIREGWLYTGDLAKMDEEGYFYIVDRKKDLILVGGYNVYPREVEEVLYDHKDVIECAVFGVPDPERGEAVRAFVVSKNPELKEEDLQIFLGEHLAKYKLPSSIEFLEELPKNTTGKILRRALKQKVLQES